MSLIMSNNVIRELRIPKAFAVIYAVGSINFLFDLSTEPHMYGDEISDLSGIARSTLGAKARVVRDLLKLDRIDHDFMRSDLSN